MYKGMIKMYKGLISISFLDIRDEYSDILNFLKVFHDKLISPLSFV